METDPGGGPVTVGRLGWPHQLNRQPGATGRPVGPTDKSDRSTDLGVIIDDGGAQGET